MRVIIPQLFTAGNLFCGFLALHYAFKGSYVPAAWLVFLGAVLDKMDGKIARVMGKDSLFGIQFDSIVDICTFGFVPAVIVYQGYLNSSWGLALAFAFVLCGAIRLARFNTISMSEDKEEDYYLGLPIPTAAICLTQFIVFETAFEETLPIAYTTNAAAALALSLAFLMISRLDYDSVPNFRGTSFSDRFKQIFFVVAIVLILYESAYFFPVTMVYICSGVYRWIVGLFSNEVTQHA